MSNQILGRLRRTTQFIFIFFLLASPIFQVIRVYRMDPFPYTNSILATNFFNALLTSIDKPLRGFLDYFYEGISGGPYSFKFYFIKFVEPMTGALTVLRNLLELNFWNIIAITSFIVPLFVAFYFGRMYCGYICPMSVITSFHLKIRRKYKKPDPPYSASVIKGFSKTKKIYMSILLLALFLNPILIQYVLPPALMQHAVSDSILYGGFTLWGLILLALFIFEFVKPAYFCRNLCPTGLFLTAAGKFRKVSLEYKPGIHCESGCHLCNDVCWLGLTPKTRIHDAACDLCNRCVIVCPQSRLTTMMHKHGGKP